MSYLAKLKRAEADKPSLKVQEQFVGAEDDPILTPEQWYRDFHAFHAQVVRDTPNLDWGWVREHRPELFKAIKAKEDELEALGNARFSVVMGLLNDWRGLVLKAEFERVESLEADPRRRA